MDIHKFVLYMFMCAVTSFMAALAFFHVYLLPAELVKTDKLVKIMSNDVAQSRLVGAISMISECRDQGVVTIPDSNGNPGVVIDCQEIKVKPLAP